MSLTLTNAVILTPAEELTSAAITIDPHGKLVYVGPMATLAPNDGEQIDLGGRLLAPGLIDIHVHGGNGITFGAGPSLSEELHAYSHWVCEHGVTGFLCTIAAASIEEEISVVDQYAAALDAGLSGAEGLGLHLEGPFLSVEKRGAFNPAWLRPPDVSAARELLAAGRGWIRQATLAPELPGASDVAELLHASGVVVAMGHTNADYACASEALRGVYRHVTHTFNAQSPFDHRAPGAVGAILSSDEVTAEVIADMIHVHPAAIRVLWRCLGTDRLVLVTDAMAGAGLADGEYELVGHHVTVKGGRASLSNGTLAGSVVTLDQCVRNMHGDLGLPLGEAVRMASLNPAHAMGLADRLGSIAVGKDASLVVLDEGLRISMTVVRGKIVYRHGC